MEAIQSVEGLSIKMFPGFVSVRTADREITGYHFLGTWKPYFWPLMGPCGNVVRGASGEHQHQTGLFLAYGGHGGESGPTNIWSDWDEPPYWVCGKMLHMGFHYVEGGEAGARIVERVLYVNGDGETILEEIREMHILALPEGECFVDWQRTVPVPDELNGGPFMLSGRVWGAACLGCECWT